MLRHTLAFAVFILSAAQANDPGPGDATAAAPYFGAWWFDADDGAASLCRIDLLATGGYGQFDLIVPSDCKAEFPLLKTVSGWQGGDGVRLATGMGGAALTLTRQADGRLAGLEDGLAYLMQRDDSTPGSAEDAERLAGDYRLWRPDEPTAICHLTLGADADGGGYALAQGKGCAAAFGLKTVNSWRPVDGKAAKGWMIALLDRAGETRGLFVQMEGAQDAMTGALNGQRLDLARLAP